LKTIWKIVLRVADCDSVFVPLVFCFEIRKTGEQNRDQLSATFSSPQIRPLRYFAVQNRKINLTLNPLTLKPLTLTPLPLEQDSMTVNDPRSVNNFETVLFGNGDGCFKILFRYMPLWFCYQKPSLQPECLMHF